MPWPPDARLVAAAAGGLGLGLGAGYAALPWLVRPFFRAVLAPRYRIEATGLEHLPATGPALLASNHVTWVDGFLLVAACPRRARFLINADYVNMPGVRRLARRCGLIPVPASGPRAQREAIAAARAALDAGEVVGIFPEAQLSRTGLLGPFFRGLEAILHGRDAVPVIPAYLDNLWGSLWSHSGDRFLWKRPEGLRRAVGVAFGPPVGPPRTAFAVRQAVLAAGVRAFELRRGPGRPMETLDPSGPRLEHPTLGLLAVSAVDFDRGGIKQVGRKPGTLGHPPPGVALRVVDAEGSELPPESEGRLEALIAGRGGWHDAGLRASLDRDGFVRPAAGPDD